MSKELTIQELLQDFALRKKEPFEDTETYEVVCELPTVFEGEQDAHRWYSTCQKVSTFKDKDGNAIFFSWEDWLATGDGCIWDQGYTLFLRDLVRVYPKQVMQTIYVPEEQV